MLPLEDWRAILGSLGVAALSVVLAFQAARQIVLGQRSLLEDPDRTYLTDRDGSTVDSEGGSVASTSWRHVLMDDRTRVFRIVCAALLVTLGVTMWGVLGTLDARAPSLRGNEIGVFRMIWPAVFFLAQVTAGVAATSTLAERRRHLAARARRTARDERASLSGRTR
jgi:hypothetical protein